MSNKTQPRILVAGTGPAGLIAALALARAGFGITLIGPEVRKDDRRTTALMMPAIQFLDGLGIIEPIRTKTAPLRVMRIVDATKRLIRSPVVTFRASEIGGQAFGLNIPNGVLNDALEVSINAEPGVEWRKTLVTRWEFADDTITAVLEDGSSATGSLAVAADGRASTAREAAGITTTTHRYEQAALVLTFSHSRGHADTSTEFHTETGPFTQVPLPGDRSSLVWVATPAEVDELAALDEAELSRRVEDRMQSMLGRVAVEPGRQIYPLSAGLPARFAQNRVALIGEAAHIFPPIGAQGLNLGIRDVQELIDIVSKNTDDPGSKAALAAYDRRRRPDIFARTGAVNLLNLSLLSNVIPAQLARSAGLTVLGGFAPLRALFMREGLRPGSGLRSVFSDLREQIRR
ncbi:UbiH/UbiF family hydroxylase [Mesorhizobium sp. ZC-5]|uniref:UbiH/UbiF family hydroxylase n=1 Tax=Mesorhizobium sp. ZC-5 TaxID=2986066 RepID=UPI0021E9956A|nr:UbiH/UbiF family hydroxylase [Mesorhizobium sp. ZC-5]MCV3241584.1 UbiH/UbiF family hydroxylase [Mesorhizobium sp. ZC-5]